MPSRIGAARVKPSIITATARPIRDPTDKSAETEAGQRDRCGPGEQYQGAQRHEHWTEWNTHLGVHRERDADAAHAIPASRAGRPTRGADLSEVTEPAPSHSDRKSFVNAPC